MSSFSDTYNPFLKRQLSSVLPPNIINQQLLQDRQHDSATHSLFSTHNLLVEEIERLGHCHGSHSAAIIPALDVLGAVQSELNLHHEAAATYRRIATIDDFHIHTMSLKLSRGQRYRHNQPTPHYERCLEALFNLGLQLNKSYNFAEAEVALRRLIPLVRRKHGDTSYQYRNTIEQLIYALRGRGCKESIKELWKEYCRSQDDEIAGLARSYSEGSYYAVNSDTSFEDYTDSDLELDFDLDIENRDDDADTEDGSDIQTPEFVLKHGQRQTTQSIRKQDADQTCAIVSHDVGVK